MLTPKFWRKYFLVYDYLNGLIPYRNILIDICNYARIRKNDKVLDIGSGTGNLSLEIEKFGAILTGIDFSREGIEIHKMKNMHADIVYANITTKLPFSDNTFDAVVSNNVLYTIPRLARTEIFKEMYRVLKPGGNIVLSNIREDFNPVKIYSSHIFLSIEEFGLLKTVIKLIRLCYPTLKIMYYNYIICHENHNGRYDFFVAGEQKKMLKFVGFKDVSDDKSVYCRQAILNSASK